MFKNNYFEIQKLKIEDIDLSSTEVKSFIIFSEIDSIGLKIKILYNDVTDLKTNLPIKGGETVELLLKDQYDNMINHKYILTSLQEISNKTVAKDSLISIEGITQDSFKLITQRLYTSYLDKTPSEIVTKILNNISPITKLNIQETKNKGSFLSPGWTKNKFIQYLAKLSYAKKGNFLFYEDINKINFVSLESLVDINSVFSFEINNKNPEYRYNIHSINEVDTFNILENTYQNIYDNTFICYNPDKKEIETNDIIYDDLNNKKLGKGSIRNDNIIEYQTPSILITPFQNNDTFKAQSEHDIIFSNYMKRMDILLNGDLERVPGEIIFINKANRIKQNEFDNEIAGTWIIEKIAYHFSQGDFKIKARITRNAVYDAPIKTNNPLSINLKN